MTRIAPRSERPVNEEPRWTGTPASGAPRVRFGGDDGPFVSPVGITPGSRIQEEGEREVGEGPLVRENRLPPPFQPGGRAFPQQRTKEQQTRA